MDQLSLSCKFSDSIDGFNGVVVSAPVSSFGKLSDGKDKFECMTPTLAATKVIGTSDVKLWVSFNGKDFSPSKEAEKVGKSPKLYRYYETPPLLPQEKKGVTPTAGSIKGGSSVIFSFGNTFPVWIASTPGGPAGFARTSTWDGLQCIFEFQDSSVNQALPKLDQKGVLLPSGLGYKVLGNSECQLVITK